MPIRVECPHCGKGINAPSKFAGKEAKCPGCGKGITIPQIGATKRPQSPAELLPEKIPCPFCSEPIQPSARKCKHCGEFLNEEDRLPAIVPTSDVAPPSVLPPSIPAEPTVTIKHEHKAKTSFFRVGFGTSCGCLTVIALALGGCLLTTGYFASEAVVSVSDTMEDLEQRMKVEEEARKAEALARAKLLKVDVAFFEAPSDGFSGSTLRIKVTNNSDSPVTKVFFHGVLRSPGRSVPWAEDDFNYAVAGGIEPGESLAMNLSPNYGSDLRDAQPDGRAIFVVTVVDVEFLGDAPE